MWSKCAKEAPASWEVGPAAGFYGGSLVGVYVECVEDGVVKVRFHCGDIFDYDMRGDVRSDLSDEVRDAWDRVEMD